MADPSLFACPTCGGPAIIVGGDSLRCPTCDDKRGSYGELHEHLSWGGPLSSDNAGDATLCTLRDWMREHLGEFSLPKLDELRDRLVNRHGLTREQVYVAKRGRIVELLRGERSEIQDDPIEQDGPIGINEWRYDGKKLDGELGGKPGKIAEYLWTRRGRKVRIADVIRDLGMGTIQDATVQRHASAISTWFADKGASLLVETGDGLIWMRGGKTTEE